MFAYTLCTGDPLCTRHCQWPIKPQKDNFCLEGVQDLTTILNSVEQCWTPHVVSWLRTEGTGAQMSCGLGTGLPEADRQVSCAEGGSWDHVHLHNLFSVERFHRLSQTELRYDPTCHFYPQEKIPQREIPGLERTNVFKATF